MAHAQDTLKYSKKQVADDITFLFKNAADIHPDLYHDITPQQLNRRTDSLVRNLPDSLSLIMAFRALSQATAFINEGHTGINIPKPVRMAIRSGTFKMIPLKVTGYRNGVFDAQLVTEDTNARWIKVNAINGVSAANLYKQMVGLKGGLSSFRTVVITNNIRFYLSVIGIKAPYRIDLTGQGEVKRTVTVDGMAEGEYTQRIGKPANNMPYTFDIRKEGYGYLNIRSMANYNKFTRFCDSVFATIDHKQIKKLVVDLRENSGGDSALGEYLLNYIADKPFRMAGESERKVSQQFRTYIMANRDIYGSDYDGYLKLPNGSFYKMASDGENNPGDKKYKYKGKVCFLIGPYTFSSANMLSAAIKDYKLSTLIGEPTGESGNDYGELCTINLPNTGLAAFTSTTLWVRPNNNKADHSPIMPDYLVKRTSVTGDNVLEYAIQWLNK